MKQHNRFRLDNTEGYSQEELSRLNAAFDRIVDIESRKNSDDADDDIAYQSWLDNIADGVLSSFGEKPVSPRVQRWLRIYKGEDNA